MPVLSMSSSIGFDPLDIELFTNETIREVMCLIEKLCEISHHRSSFIPTIDQLKRFDLELTIGKKFDWFQSPFAVQPIFVGGNLSNILTTIPINISSNPNVIENIMIGVDCSPQESDIYTALFKEFRVTFFWSYEEIPNHTTHLRAIFDQCRKYKIRLNPLKCNFCVVAGQLLGFIVSKHGIMVDPFKVEAIPKLSPPHT